LKRPKTTWCSISPLQTLGKRLQIIYGIFLVWITQKPALTGKLINNSLEAEMSSTR
jgi:hypothetical protein